MIRYWNLLSKFPYFTFIIFPPLFEEEWLCVCVCVRAFREAAEFLRVLGYYYYFFTFFVWRDKKYLIPIELF